jgi:hypothetical protein
MNGPLLSDPSRDSHAVAIPLPDGGFLDDGRLTRRSGDRERNSEIKSEAAEESRNGAKTSN